ncbi:uncharacterized protein L203_104157 [Cryptococcus depauperatus CBS 7841]|uniref:Uncharacterized protein n=1 Tax=Cryptococcus depauperatus CBS 7841 TaxID=1295531 RepID=A0A1E3HJS6_9TREE|nr:hypothetical protein L203_06463 [Cryptococcus depauperatus CBS 7841]
MSQRNYLSSKLSTEKLRDDKGSTASLEQSRLSVASLPPYSDYALGSLSENPTVSMYQRYHIDYPENRSIYCTSFIGDPEHSCIRTADDDGDRRILRPPYVAKVKAFTGNSTQWSAADKRSFNQAIADCARSLQGKEFGTNAKKIHPGDMYLEDDTTYGEQIDYLNKWIPVLIDAGRITVEEVAKRYKEQGVPIVFLDPDEFKELTDSPHFEDCTGWNDSNVWGEEDDNGEGSSRNPTTRAVRGALDALGALSSARSVRSAIGATKKKMNFRDGRSRDSGQ